MLMWRAEAPGGGVRGINCQVANVGDANGVAAWPVRGQWAASALGEGLVRSGTLRPGTAR
eukprot:8741257-Pyramimonas_sp.AAC.1